MRKYSKIFLAAFIVGVFRVIFCGSIFDVGSGETERFSGNFEICLVLIVIMLGLVAYGAFLFFKERQSINQKNKLIIEKKK